ncbi:MAG: dehypoxanthine futalosine cyclase [Bacteroidales bacterium]|jgi:cyclic dehypoxanthinyl futalosine synthase|nr:dehypoxanthine futalosine cyclase [Bacteroidales bacterium]
MTGKMNTKKIVDKALALDFLTPEEGIFLFGYLSLADLMAIGHAIRQRHHPDDTVSWIIDRNVNITNVCISGCKFCNFYRTGQSKEAYITTIPEYCIKIEEMKRLGGNQLLLQGGMHPNLGLDFYEKLFSDLKQRYPEVRLHALGPPEIVHLARMERTTYRKALERLMAAGLDSLPGAGAEILVDRVRKILSPVKCSAGEWLDVMKAAHELDLTTSATMMFGHLETLKERFLHLAAIRDLQSKKPPSHKGFLNFIPWPFQDRHTALKDRMGIQNKVTPEEYIRMIAISRIMLPNIPHIQASWLTVGKQTAQLCLHAGANDFGSIMIEENVVSVAGANHQFDADGIQQAIREAGFEPRLRDQDFELH